MAQRQILESSATTISSGESEEASVGRWQLLSRSERQTLRIGRELGRLLSPGHVLLLIGDFGAGKTVLVRGIGESLAVSHRVASPSFVFIHEHQGRRGAEAVKLYHVDLYRIETPEAVAELGLEEYLGGDGICVIEWADRAGGRLPEGHLAIYFQITGARSRSLSFEAHGSEYIKILARLKGRIAHATSD